MTFSISQTGYRYRPALAGDNELTVDWLLRLTQAHYPVPSAINQVWPMDCMSHSLSNGKRIPTFYDRHHDEANKATVSNARDYRTQLYDKARE